MSVKTGRAEGVGDVRIDRERCIACGACASVCSGGALYYDKDHVEINQKRYLGCIACGQCMAICPKECIEVQGRDLMPEDALPLPKREARAAYGPLHNLLLARRSIRHYKEQPVPREMIEQILHSAATAPMGIPPTDVGVLVLDGKEKVRQFRDDLLTGLKDLKRSRMFALIRMFMGKDMRALFNTFIFPAIDFYNEKAAVGVDAFFYDAPLAMFFYTAPIGDPVDPTIAGTYAMVAAESLGLGTCMLGFPGPVLKDGKALRKKYGLPKKLTPGVTLIFGYPAVHYQRAIRRRFASVRYVP